MYEYMQYKFIDLMLSKCCSYILQRELQGRKMCVNSKWCAIDSFERNSIVCCAIYYLNEKLQRKTALNSPGYIKRQFKELTENKFLGVWLWLIHYNFQTKLHFQLQLKSYWNLKVSLCPAITTYTHFFLSWYLAIYICPQDFSFTKKNHHDWRQSNAYRALCSHSSKGRLHWAPTSMQRCH